MPRPRTPSHIADATQLHKAHPKRNRGPDPVNESALSPPPDWFSDEQRKYWRHVLTVAAPGLLRASDHLTVVNLCREEANIRRYERMLDVYDADLAAYKAAFKGRPSQAKKELKELGRPDEPRQLSQAVYNQHAKLGQECGLSPASRTKVGTAAAPKSTENEFAVWERECEEDEARSRAARKKPPSDFDDI
jgi:phage terminase small subunit